MTAWAPGRIVTDLTAADIEAVKAALTAAQTVGLTAFCEARSRLEHGVWVTNPIEAFADVCHVIDNRAHDPRWPGGHKAVCLAPAQFSCWWPFGGVENYATLLRRAQELIAGLQPLPKLASAVAIADSVIGGRHQTDLGPHTCHYYATSSAEPIWAQGHTPVAERWGHRFYSGIK